MNGTRAPRLALALFLLAGCAGARDADDAGGDVEDAGPIDAHVERDAGLDAAIDAASEDAGEAELDAGDLDAASALDASDATVRADAGPIDAGILRTEDPPTRPSRPPIAPFAECTVRTAHDVIAGAGHIAACDAIAYPYHPPSAGAHFGQWADFGVYTAPVPWGFLVHAMEHGAVVLAYNCAADADCDAVRAEYASIIADHGLDPMCRIEDDPSRFIVVPDPALPVPIAAVAWEEVYLATCLDPPSLRAFVTAHYGMAPEDFCTPGVDLSKTAWCP